MRMGSYEKLAILLLRVIAACWTIFLTFAWAMYGVELATGVNVQHYPTHTLIGNLGYLFIGLFVFLLSKPLGRLLGRGLDNQA